MNLSYWEYNSWLTDIDFTIVGSGIVGLSSALFLKEKYPTAKVLVLEKGILPQGASTKNAGFACFGSVSEILSDLKNHTEQEVVDLVNQRRQGIKLLREILGDKELGYQQLGGHEVFLEKDTELYDECLEKVPYINSLLEPVFGSHPFKVHDNKYGFDKVENSYISHQFEGQLDTGQMMLGLLKNCVSKGVLLLNDVEVQNIEDTGPYVSIITQHFDVRSKKVLLATNGFARQFLKEEMIQPARAQVLITEPVPDLDIKGTFHLDEGYYYFRNVDNRILLGGGRNLDFKGEQTTELKETKLIQDALEGLLKEVILPRREVNIAHRWSGIMGVGPQKKPIIKPISDHIFCGVRLGGMGIALGTLVGKKLAEIAS
ncbi:NAD(P)/FAD-dependent oxidoreductase [Flagellimonas allohymeniacidonis]|uniref:FAD-binding oxidoreductase n=1 Tax=Flagellimonas allohymeniacidonis TaxID=2517819 RepID=A0A4Q8QD84_9FLAO|nr:FAD-dependent oxidoreductase [Allomuricauda hymeniacidonis]TAI47654.1 FAD-binding oxidoreductase [Allomuricauda hymeniacidonis]